MTRNSTFPTIPNKNSNLKVSALSIFFIGEFQVLKRKKCWITIVVCKCKERHHPHPTPPHPTTSGTCFLVKYTGTTARYQQLTNYLTNEWTNERTNELTNSMSPHICAYTYSFIYQHASSSIRNSYSTFSNTWQLVCRLLRSTKVMFFFHRHAHHKDKLGRRLGACHVLVLVGSLILSLCCHDRIDIVNARTQVAKIISFGVCIEEEQCLLLTNVTFLKHPLENVIHVIIFLDVCAKEKTCGGHWTWKGPSAWRRI